MPSNVAADVRRRKPNERQTPPFRYLSDYNFRPVHRAPMIGRTGNSSRLQYCPGNDLKYSDAQDFHRDSGHALDRTFRRESGQRRVWKAFPRWRRTEIFVMPDAYTEDQQAPRTPTLVLSQWERR
jgi:hypothetical protein